MSHTLSLTNKKVFDFYEEHKNLNFENMNVIFVEILENLLKNANPTLDVSLATSLLDGIKGLQNQFNNINDAVTKNLNEVSTIFTLKFVDFKKEYMQDLQMILANNASEKLAPIIKEYNENLLDKTKIMFGDLLPKNQETLQKNIEGSLRTLQETINNDTNLMLKSSLTKEVLQEYISSLDEKFSNTLLNSQNLLNTIVSSSEQRLENKLGEIKEISTLNKNSQSNLFTNINELLKKMENSSSKGKISENLLFNVLHSLYPTAQIESVGNIKETGDILIQRKNKPKILFENKNYDRNVGQEEVRKFIRDVEIQKCSGIMMAQHYGIANKNNFEIEIHDNNVLLYMHNVEYDSYKIKAAVDIIDHFKNCLDDLESGTGEQVTLDKEFLDDINKEYQNFVNNKLIHIKTIKDYQQKLIAQVDDIKIPTLEHYLSRMYASTASKENTCEYCNYVAKNLRALTAHHRGCVLKKQYEQAKREKLKKEYENQITV
tara:strand:- start:211 stop:1677 length:1467 start_codon:yes stop_codon:yes gene_type:complete